jgi:biopolymer transport protein ExbB
LTLLLTGVVAAAGLSAQDLEGMAAGAAADLEKSLAELASMRQQVESERLPLARRLRELEQQFADRRAELARAQRFAENQLVALNALKAEARSRGDEVKYLDSLLTEYTRAFRSRLNFIEEPRYQAVLEAVEKAAVAPGPTPAERFDQRSAILKTALERAAAALGGEIFPGQALDQRGLVQAGRVALFGPVAMFASDAGDTAGLLQQELNRADPTVLAVDRATATASRALVTTGQGQMMLDPTLGNAFKLTLLEENLWEKIKKGGWAMAPLLALGAASLVVALFKWVQLARVRLATPQELEAILKDIAHGSTAGALTRARAIGGPAGDLLAAAVEHVDDRKEYIEEIAYEKMLGARTRLERGLPFLALAATTGPLLGLLGTVMGMIATFKLISSFGSGDPKVLAAGISEALICTATGMAVAIPALLAHAFLTRRAKGLVGSLEQTAVGFINGLPQSNSLALS